MTDTRRLVAAMLVCIPLLGLVARGNGEDGSDPDLPGIRIPASRGAAVWAVEEPQPGDEIVIVGRIAAYGNEPFTQVLIETFLDPEGARVRRRYAFDAEGATPEDLDDPMGAGLVRVRATVARVPAPGRAGLILAGSIERVGR